MRSFRLKLYGPQRKSGYPGTIEDVQVPKIYRPGIAREPRPARIGVRPRYQRPPETIIRTLPPWNFPPPDARPFDLLKQLNLTVGNPSGIVLTYTIPDRHAARLSAFGQDIDVEDSWDDVKWEIRVGGKPIYPYAPNIIGQMGRLYAPDKIFWLVEENSVVEVFADKDTCPTDVLVAARLKGWSWPL